MAVQKTTATFGNFPLLLDQSVSWSLKEGVLPVIRTFSMAPVDARSVEAQQGPLTLKITAPDAPDLTVDNLWVLNVSPGPLPFISHVVVADRRWMWSYTHVLRRYNIRRNIGIKRVVDNAEFAVDFDRAFQVAFWRWSLKTSGRRWVALEMVKDILEAVAKAEKNFHGTGFKVTIDDRIGNRLKGLPIEDVVIDDPGDQAVRRAVSYLPEAGVTVDYNGDVIVFSRAGGDESEIVKAMMPEIWGEGHTDLVRNHLVRPKEIHVLFTREVEVRFDFLEQAFARGQTVTAEPLGELRRMENVFPSSDYELEIPGVEKAVPQGTFVTFDDAFRTWGELPIRKSNSNQTFHIDHDLVQRAFIPHMDLWSSLQLAGAQPDGDGNLEPWLGRITNIENHYRQTFRLNSRWMDRILSFRAYRLATVDPQSGQRGPSRAYGDYSILFTQRSIWRNYDQGATLDYAINHSAYPANGILDSTADVSPAIVSVMDHDQGVIHLEYRGTNPLSGDTRTILPSQIILGSMPTHDLRQRKRSIAFNAVIESLNPPRLSPTFKMATILTCVPASPNTAQQLHRVVVTPNQIAKFLPPSQTTGLNNAKGPIMEIRIGAGVEVARIQWLDSKSVEIERVFGLTEGEPDLNGLVLNEGSSDLRTGASLQSIAQAEAARAYGALVDRYEGSMTGYMNGRVHLNGWTDEIAHELRPDGSAVTRIVFPPEIPKFDLLSFLDSTSRAAILKLVQPE